MEEQKSNRVKLNVLGVTYTQIQNGAYALVLAEENGLRRIPIIISSSEAQAIAMRLEHLVAPRPLTHDLFVSFAHSFGVRLIEVFIYKFEDGVFCSELLFDDGTRRICIDSRTSDAVAIAIRAKAPIYTTEELIRNWGIVFDEPESEEAVSAKKTRQNDWEDMDVEELQERLDEAVEEEAYEIASQIQRELKKRDENRFQ
ncbi:MAG: bifunctional nuclease family protein [Bacteroidaceae bacterium]|nr:bifunctional nuclease family protein [Bacteroidaceae bacterium]